MILEINRSAKVTGLGAGLRRVAVAVFILLGTSSACLAGDVAVLLGRNAHDAEVQQIRQVADFYGLTLRLTPVDSQAGEREALARLRNTQTLAAIISHDALPTLNRNEVLAALRRAGGTHAPVLIFGATADGNAVALRLWSGGAIGACTAMAQGYRPDVLQVADLELSGSLAGIELPAVAAPVCSFSLDSGSSLQSALTARGGGVAAPVLVRAQEEAAETFFVPGLEPFDSSWVGKPLGLVKAFSSMAPFFLFLRSAAGDYGWHQDGRYANFTIDDPWLTEPYGHIAYGALLAEMEKHDYHTTIAFVPWNFDRSQPDVVQLFRDYPERFSICMHGNNHAHREFGDYQEHSLDAQVQDIRQGIARMERFRELTGIPYDRFMIFPHFVAPEGTFAALSEYDFLGTANSINVPDGTVFPTDPAFLLRPYTPNYGHLLSFFRYSVEEQVPGVEIAVHSFLGNPLLFYGHQQFFENGIGAFNRVADLVNHVQANTHWTSLGEIARHTYLVRRAENDAFDVRMLSSEIELRNQEQRTAVFHVEREADPSAAAGGVTVDGMPADVERTSDGWRLTLEIPAGAVRDIRAVPQNDFDVTRVDIAKTSTYVSMLRRASDFRDMYLSKSSVGRTITRAYYQRGWDSYQLGLEKRWWSIAAGLAFALAGLLYARKRARRAASRGIATH
jgi:hypothetical protein